MAEHRVKFKIPYRSLGKLDIEFNLQLTASERVPVVEDPLELALDGTSPEEVADGTLLTVVESGFDGIPPWRRAEAYRGNEQGWAVQMKAIEQYVQQAAKSWQD